MASPRLVVVGNGMAGARLVGEVQRRASGSFDITVLGTESGPAYNRILLPAVLAGDKTEAEIALPPSDGVTIRAGQPVVAVEPSQRRLRTEAGEWIDYDQLVLATGSMPIVLRIPGAGLPGVVTFRDLHDVQRMIAAAGGGHAVVIGGGLLGLEAAEGLRRRGMTVMVVHLRASLMERQLDAPAGMLLRGDLGRRGIGFELSAETAEIVGEKVVSGVRLADGRVLPADLVVMAVGISPNAALAREAGLTCNRGVVVDDTMRTSDPAIYAVGECVEHRGRSYGLVAPLWEQVEICARQLTGDSDARYEGSTPATSLKVTGIDLYAAGEISAADGDEIILSDPGRGVYRKLVLRDGRLSGAVLYGDATDGPWYCDLMRAGQPVDGLRQNMVFGKAFAA